MPTATLTFDLNDADDVRSHLECIKAGEVIAIVFDFDNFLREQIKYNNKLTEEQCQIYETVRDKLHELANEADLSNLIFT